MNANVKCFILCIYKTILKPSKQFLTVSNHKVFSLHALWMTILRPSRQLLTVSNHQVFRFYTLLKLSKVFHPSICSSFVLNLRWLLLRVSRWITNMLVLSKYLLTVRTGGCHPLFKIDGWLSTRATRSNGGPAQTLGINVVRQSQAMYNT